MKEEDLPPYFWRYREDGTDYELDMILVPYEDASLPSEGHGGETTIIWWD